jgi:hypothetical protein
MNRLREERLVYYTGVDVHKRTISYCVKYSSGAIHSEGVVRKILAAPLTSSHLAHMCQIERTKERAPDR